MSGQTVQMLTRTASGSAREGGGSATGSGGGSGSNPVKLAGEESKDKLYEPKHSKKLVRVLTVVAYMFSVSLAAIMLSVYYVFLWNPRDPPLGPRHASSSAPSCQVAPAPVQYQQELKILRQHLLQHHQQLQQQQQRHAAAQDGNPPQFQPLHQQLEASSNITSNLTSLVSSTPIPHTTMNHTADNNEPDSF